MIARGRLTVRSLLAATLIAASAGSVEADSKSLPLTDFLGVSLDNGIKAVVVPGEAFSVTAQSSRAGDIQDLKTTVDGGVLKAWYEWNIFQLFNFSGRDLTLQITMPELDAVALSGGASLSANTVPSDDLRLDASGGSRATLNAASAKRYTINLSGGATATISGTCYNAAINASGGATLSAKDLICADVTGGLSGGAKASVTATASVTADASGGATFQVYGSPTLTRIKSSGGAKIDFPN